jgi:tRNA threonylcarbamoyladenosine biosynthesis protein TsaE
VSGVRQVLATAEDTRAFGAALGGLLRAGDLVVLTGELGAGKTTLTQGLAQGLRVRGPVTSPTFVIAREHPSLVGGPSLVHVDAYRLGGEAELDDLDLDTALEEAVTVVEWGAGLADHLSPSRLEVVLSRPDHDDADQTRLVSVAGHGLRWTDGEPLATLRRDATGTP